MSETSEEETQQTCEGDLIDLNASSPILPEAPAAIDYQDEALSDNLIDTEPSLLEQKLQSSSFTPKTIEKINHTVDIEDILITFDDDQPNNPIINEIDEVDGEDITDGNDSQEAVEEIESCENCEAYAILQSLDEVLNSSLVDITCSTSNSEDSDDSSINESSIEDHTQKYIEDCLLDLDNYLKAYDTSTCEDCNHLTYATKSSNSDRSQRSSVSSTHQGADQDIVDLDDIIVSECLTEDCDAEDDDIKRKLRQIEENYRKFIASGCINRGYLNNEDDGLEGDVGHRRASSVCDRRKETLNSYHPGRATISAPRRHCPELYGTSSDPPLRRQIAAVDTDHEGHISPWSRTSATPGDCSDEDIDWSWVQDVARDVIQERRAHAAGDCCTGTVVVEPLHKAPAGTSSSCELVMPEEHKQDSKQVGTWLRSSMRRLRHFRLPSDADPQRPTLETPDDGVGMDTVAVDLTNADAIAHPPIILVTGPENVRPMSAPSRLPASSCRVPVNSTSRACHVSGDSNNRSRSRSRSGESFHSAVSHLPEGRARSSSASSRSRRRRSLSSSGSSLASTVDTSTSCTPAPTPDHNRDQIANGDVIRSCERNRQADMPDAESPLGQWPHGFSSMMACLGCTLGLFNISRFAVLTIHFGANFIIQFLLLTLVFGLPLFTLQLCLGQQLGSGVIDMWRISPLFQGVGVSLLIVQMFIGIYSIIGVSWMFVYFRDSFITKVDEYRWAEPFRLYRSSPQITVNGTYRLSETVPDYFSGIVLQRHHLPSGTAYSTIKFQSAFNLAVVWMIVFVSLSKGLRSYGKVVYVFTMLPVFGTFVICAKILGMMPEEFMNVIFPETAWNEFFINSRCWLAAAQETFLTWGLLGAAVMQIASHNRHKHLLQRDSSLVAIVTIVVLLLVAFLANTCVQILKSYGYSYIPDSFEYMNSYIFLRPSNDPLPPNLANTPVRYMVHNSFIVGERTIVPGNDHTIESGYQALRFATELVPATFAVMGSELMSPFWAVLFYFVLIMFGISQQLAIWHSVITGIMAMRANMLKSWETTITFFSCACGFIFGLPMTTELGIYVVYFMDYVFGGIWWLAIVILLQILAVFMVRGRPYSGDTVVTALFTPNNHPCLLSWAPALLSFVWNVILPVVLMVLCISTFKNGDFREIFVWHHAPSAEYWPLWARQTASIMQLIPILCIPLVAVIQSYRYLTSGPDDILERIQLLYRPPLGEHMEDLHIQENGLSNSNPNGTTGSNPIAEDPPPKYTPPPSYTTATGARIAKFLRQSIRRSVRRIANVLGEGTISRQNNPATPSQSHHPPPDYNDVLVEMNQRSSNNNEISITVPDCVPPTGRNIRISTLERLRSLQSSSSALTAAEVASILRSSFRRSTIRTNRPPQPSSFTDNSISSLSAENLIESAAPIGETSLIMDSRTIDRNAAKTESKDFASSVI